MSARKLDLDTHEQIARAARPGPSRNLNGTMTREIELRDGEVALVDDADFDRLSQYKWSLHTQGYAQRRDGDRRIYMHVEVFGPRPDHRNGNKLDNRRSNLRAASKSQNAMNSRPRSDNLLGLKGVSFHRPTGKWRARVKVSGREYTSYHDTTIEATVARDAMAVRLHGEFARLNHGGAP